ncbi:DUF4258 domain-containing protein [Anatilimnocola floriformis]|uniref:DUF4258 domain-containing protein n=1 Tax=Anatilimnocola floriformis TaxID=2948575 RepID=UPI0020C459B8|nr:DUF4258 domain-containing protein [Anatilimnocola floriformis]
MDRDIQIIWDIEDDPQGNIQHIAEHDITVEEVEQVLLDPASQFASNRNPAGNKLTFGFTAAGRYLAVVWEHVGDDPLTVYPVTAYDAPEPRKRKAR